MKIFLTFLFSVLSLVPLKAQSLDYARDVFFYDSSLVPAKNFYYQYSPLLSLIQVYAGKGLNVVVICPEQTPMTIAKKNIELEIAYEFNRPYLSNLNIFNSSTIFKEFLLKNKVDVIIMEESYVEELADIREKHLDRIMVFNSEGKLINNSKQVPLVRNWWHYNFKLDSISKELIKVWHSKENYRTFILFIERSKNFTISLHKRPSIIIFFLLLGFVVVSGFYYRFKQIHLHRYFLGAMATLLLLTLLTGYYKEKTYQGFVNNVYTDRNPKLKTLEDIMVALEESDILVKVACLRSITERLIDGKEESYLKKNAGLISDKMKVLLSHEDERVRMWSIAVMANLKDENLINFLAQKNWDSEDSYLVRTRVVRALAAFQNQNTNEALIKLAKFEQHPYVYTELRSLCIERDIWAKGEPIESVH